MPFKSVSKLFTPCIKYQFNNPSIVTVSMTAFTLTNMYILFSQVNTDSKLYKSKK